MSRGEALNWTPHGCCAQTDTSFDSSTPRGRIRGHISSSIFSRHRITRRRSMCSGDCCGKSRSATGLARTPLILDIIRSSARHGQAVSRSLRVGVIEAVQHLLGGLNKCGTARPLATVRRVADGRVSSALPDVCRVAWPCAQLASDLPRKLYRRIAARPRRTSRQGAGPVGGAAGHRAARAQRMPRRKPDRASVQRPPVFSRTRAHRRVVRRRR